MLGAPGLATRNMNATRAPGIATRTERSDATPSVSSAAARQAATAGRPSLHLFGWTASLARRKEFVVLSAVFVGKT